MARPSKRVCRRNYDYSFSNSDESDTDFDSDDSIKDKEYCPDESSNNSDSEKEKKPKAKNAIEKKKKTITISIKKNYLPSTQSTTSLMNSSSDSDSKNEDQQIEGTRIGPSTSTGVHSIQTNLDQARHVTADINGDTEPTLDTFFNLGEPPISNINRGTLPTPEKKSDSRWRQSNIEIRKRVKSKVKRNWGYAYKNAKGKLVEPRSLGEACTCKRKCRELLQNTENNIFNSFWDLQTYEKQNTYLFSSLKVIPKKRSYKKKTKRQESARICTIEYYVKVKGIDIKVCKTEFLAIHGLQNSSKRIKLIAKQISQGRSTPKKDGRGKHTTRPNKLPLEKIQSIHDHIQSIPKYVSHYSRKINPNKVYFNQDLNISSLYKDHYLDWCNEINVPPVTEDRYRRIFCTHYNIGFKLPKSDTCATCDSLNIDIGQNKDNEIAVKDLKQKLQLHQTRANAMQENIKQETKINQENKVKEVIAFDLQQALPTPMLTVGPAFYLRKAWTYNLCVHNCVTEKATMYMWSETIAKRGSSDIASILLKYLNNLENPADHLIVFTDNCGGQNKNWTIMSLWQQLIRENMFKTIEHRFLVSGHTYLPCDRDFGVIERYKKRITQVFSPEDWYDIVRKSNRKNGFDVVVMKQNDFFCFDGLTLVKKQTTVDKQPVKFSEVRCFKFDENYPNSMFVKYTLNGDFTEVNVGKRGLRINDNILKNNSLPQKYCGPVALNPKKIQDLRKLLKFIPPINQTFYTQLMGDQNPNPEESKNENIDGAEESDMV